jgi:hypothetical protein
MEEQQPKQFHPIRITAYRRSPSVMTAPALRITSSGVTDGSIRDEGWPLNGDVAACVIAGRTHTFFLRWPYCHDCHNEWDKRDARVRRRRGALIRSTRAVGRSVSRRDARYRWTRAVSEPTDSS